MIGSTPIGPVFPWILCPQRQRERFAYGIMYMKAVLVGLHEWKRADAFLGILRRCIRAHGAKQGYGHTPHDRGGFQYLSRLRIGNVGDIQSRKFFDDPLSYASAY